MASVTPLAPPSARLLDLTRLVSRAGRVLTGVDRVERAYADAVLQASLPLWGLVQSSLGYLLLDKSGITAIMQATATDTWGKPDLLSRLSLKLDKNRQAGQSLARKHAIARCSKPGLGRMLRNHLPNGTGYINVGHSNLGARCLAAVRDVPDARITMMIHDTIPLDYPDFQRPGTVQSFDSKFRRVIRNADLILCPSDVSKSDILRHAGDALPPVLAVPLGVTPTAPAPGDLPATLDLSQPFFLCLGTIEPRKNHALLLDLWEEMGTAAPQLFICGSRGWNNEAVFRRLDQNPTRITELAGLSDGAIAALLAQTHGLLFPSIAEGYGLPLIEAAALGAPVICGDMAITREVLGDRAVYLALSDRYQWKKSIEAAAARPNRPDAHQRFVPPSWEEHFKTVLRHC